MDVLTYVSFDPAKDIPSLEGKVILSTGANEGIGKQSALELSKHNSEEILNPQVVSPVQRYCQSKLANLLYAREAAKRLPQCLQFVSRDPGGIQTGLFMREPGDEQMRTLQTALVPKHCGTV
ncbi:Dehydrogenase/reductase SDR family member 13 [Cytospora mali]|uniref:Dehydrogenase/reductase SDR family member 13 n=1 Tax=Cytospora mali TaxID=578113 RepID=A0A194USV3_CYTMA|nr:Dehydrogenase/reductase SDR family member 13 [Valsa mali var. pyri (nom. inval.)]